MQSSAAPKFVQTGALELLAEDVANVAFLVLGKEPRRLGYPLDPKGARSLAAGLEDLARHLESRVRLVSPGALTKES